MDRDEGCVDVIEVNLASGLEFVEEIQKTERKCSARLFQCCRKPSHAKKLNTRWLLSSRLPAVAVADADSRNARNVKEGEVYSGGRHCTDFTDMVAELIRCTKIMQRDPGEELACPFLEIAVRLEVGSGRRQVPHLNIVQWIQLVGGDGTALAEHAPEETVKATVAGVWI